MWKPTKNQIDLIKAAAARESRVAQSAVLLEPGIRGNTKDASRNVDIPGGQYNIALISDDPNFNDTDLSDYGDWAEFRKGVVLTDDGKAIVDFYIRRRFDPYSDLHGNVTVYYEGGRIVRIHGYPGEYAAEIPPLAA